MPVKHAIGNVTGMREGEVTGGLAEKFGRPTLILLPVKYGAGVYLDGVRMPGPCARAAPCTASQLETGSAAFCPAGHEQ